MKKIQTNKAPQVVGPYSQGIISNDFIFLSGQIAVDPETNTFNSEATIEEQTKRVLENLKGVLKEAGLTLFSVVKTEIFITDILDYKTVNEVYSKYFSNDPMPARQAVEVSALPLGAKIEISCIAKK